MGGGSVERNARDARNKRRPIGERKEGPKHPNRLSTFGLTVPRNGRAYLGPGRQALVATGVPLSLLPRPSDCVSPPPIKASPSEMKEAPHPPAIGGSSGLRFTQPGPGPLCCCRRRRLHICSPVRQSEGCRSYSSRNPGFWRVGSG